MRREGILVNGVRSTGIDALDRGLQYGDGVFRTLGVVAGKVRWWEDQYRKLADDCAALNLACPDKGTLENEVRELAGEPGVGGVKIIVTRGSGERGYALPAKAAPSRIVLGFAPSGRENLDVRVRWCELRLASQPRLAGIKHLNRLENVLARAEWRDPAIAEGLLMDAADAVICGTMSNLFLVEQGRLVTPDLSCCGVAGVARGRILRALARQGQPAEIGLVTRERLLAADALLLCNSLIGVWRVAELGDRRWPDEGWAEKLRNWLNEAH